VAIKSLPKSSAHDLDSLPIGPHWL